MAKITIRRDIKAKPTANGEILCNGETIGWTRDLGKYLSEPNK